MARNLQAIVLLLTASMVPGAGRGDEAGRQLVDGFITDITTLAGRFEQSLTDANGEVVEVTRGTLEIMRPGRFRWSYVEPYEQVLVADGRNIWSYDIDLEQVTVKPQAQALNNTPALLLGGSEDAMQQFLYEGSFNDDDLTWVRLIPKNTDSGFLRVELGFSGEQLNRMVFHDYLEQKTVVNLHDVVVNEPIEEQRFEFKVPDGVDVVGTPAIAEVSAP